MLSILSFVLTIPPPPAVFSEDTSGSNASGDRAGSIGQPIASRFRLFLDYSHDRVIFEPLSSVGAPFDRAFAGAVIAAEGKDYKTFVIDDVLEDSPATEAGVQKGDVIVAIDDRPAAELTLAAVLQLFERPAARRVKLRRGDRIVTVTWTPRAMV